MRVFNIIINKKVVLQRCLRKAKKIQLIKKIPKEKLEKSIKDGIRKAVIEIQKNKSE